MKPNRHVFAYASWMDINHFSLEYRVSPESLGVARAANWGIELYSAVPSGRILLNLVPRLGKEVWGRAYSLTGEEWPVLCAQDHGEFQPHDLFATLSDGSIIQAYAFVAPPREILEPVQPPAEEYAKKILAALTNMGVPEAYLSQMRSLMVR
jgi:hypothetical protein